MFYAKKSLGQNFLKSEKILAKIIQTADLKDGDLVLEIGPGKGVLTEKLLEKVKKVVAVEKDARLIEFLRNKFALDIQNGKLELISADILDFQLPNFRFGHSMSKFGGRYKIVANIPYYITGKFLRKFLSADCQPSKMVLLLQKEVARRIVGSAKTEGGAKQTVKESILSISVKVYGEPKYIQTVKAENFAPAPKVDSALLLIDNISKNFFKNIDEAVFFQLIRAGFSKKRKMLVNNLSQRERGVGSTHLVVGVPSGGKEGLVQIFEKVGLSPKIRAEDLSLSEWQNLYRARGNSKW